MGMAIFVADATGLVGASALDNQKGDTIGIVSEGTARYLIRSGLRLTTLRRAAFHPAIIRMRL